MPRLYRDLVSVCLLICLVGMATGAFVASTGDFRRDGQGASESSLAATPVMAGDSANWDGRRGQARAVGRARCDADPIGVAEERLRLRLRLSTMECPDDRPPSQTLRSIRLRHLRMGNSDADHLSPTGA